MLDEPTSSLDLGHQHALLGALRALADEGRAVCVVLHDLAVAARWAERVIVLSGGRILADGTPRDVITAPTIEQAFGVRTRVIEAEGSLIVLPG